MYSFHIARTVQAAMSAQRDLAKRCSPTLTVLARDLVFVMRTVVAAKRCSVSLGQVPILGAITGAHCEL